MDGWTDGRMDGRTDGKSPHSTGLHPLLEPLPKNRPRYTKTNQIGLGSCSKSIERRHSYLKSSKVCLCHVRLPCWCPGGPYHTFGPIWVPSGPKNEPKYTQTNQICLCLCSNSIVWGHPSLECGMECLHHIRLPCWYLNGHI